MPRRRVSTVNDNFCKTTDSPRDCLAWKLNFVHVRICGCPGTCDTVAYYCVESAFLWLLHSYSSLVHTPIQGQYKLSQTDCQCAEDFVLQCFILIVMIYCKYGQAYSNNIMIVGCSFISRPHPLARKSSNSFYDPNLFPMFTKIFSSREKHSRNEIID